MEKEKRIDFIDNTVDIGKEPLPITDPEIKKIHEQLMNEYKDK